MSAREIIESGLLEMYCLGVAAPEEMVIVAMHADNDEVMAALSEIENTLIQYAVLSEKLSPRIKQRILDTILQQETESLGLPDLLSESSLKADWWDYLQQQNIKKPAGNVQVWMVELPSSKNLKTYVVFAQKGALVEEKHTQAVERLFMLQGTCIISFQGRSKKYKQGDFIEIPRDTVHFAEATFEGTMILIGQRFAA